MKTKTQREAEFREELQELLNKHGATLNITDDGRPYGMHNPICIIEMEGSFDYENNHCVLEYTEFEL